MSEAQTLTVIRPGTVTGVDDYGQPTYGPDQTIPIAGCDVQPLLGVASTEQEAAVSDVVMTRWRFFAPVGADIHDKDKAQCNIVTEDMQVDGEPVIWPDFDGVPDHVEGYLKRWA